MNAIETYLAVLAALVTWGEFGRWRQRRELRKHVEVINERVAAAQVQLERELGKLERRERVQ